MGLVGFDRFQFIDYYFRRKKFECTYYNSDEQHCELEKELGHIEKGNANCKNSNGMKYCERCKYFEKEILHRKPGLLMSDSETREQYSENIESLYGALYIHSQQCPYFSTEKYGFLGMSERGKCSAGGNMRNVNGFEVNMYCLDCRFQCPTFQASYVKQVEPLIKNKYSDKCQYFDWIYKECLLSGEERLDENTIHEFCNPRNSEHSCLDCVVFKNEKHDTARQSKIYETIEKRR